MIVEDGASGKVETSFFPYGRGRGIRTAADGRIEPDFSSSGHTPPSVIPVAPPFRRLPALVDGPGFVDPASNKTVFPYAHPIFWAAFSLIGDGGGSPGA